jgi:hypothetical protein
VTSHCHRQPIEHEPGRSAVRHEQAHFPAPRQRSQVCGSDRTDFDTRKPRSNRHRYERHRAAVQIARQRGSRSARSLCRQ